MPLTIRKKVLLASLAVFGSVAIGGVITVRTMGQLAADAEVRELGQGGISSLFAINLELARELAASGRGGEVEALLPQVDADLMRLGERTDGASNAHVMRADTAWGAYSEGIRAALEHDAVRRSAFEATTGELPVLVAKLSSASRAMQRADEDLYEYHVETAADTLERLGDLRNAVYKLVALPHGEELDQTELAVRLAWERNLSEIEALLVGSEELELDPVTDPELAQELEGVVTVARNYTPHVEGLLASKLALEREVAGLATKLGAVKSNLYELIRTATAASEVAQLRLKACLGGLALGTTLLLIGGLWFFRGLLGGLTCANRIADGIREGDLEQEIPERANDELGRLFVALCDMQASLRESRAAVEKSRELESKRSAQLERLHAEQVQQAEELQRTLAESRSHAERDLERSRNEMQRAAELSHLVESSLSAAEQGAEIVRDAVESMEKINDSSRRIATIIGAIDGIAFQTRLLGLNAAVEAARAGEAGRGFSVVASEVGSLAQRSANSASEIKELIHQSLARVDEGAEHVNASGATLTEIVASVREVSAFIDQLAGSSGSGPQLDEDPEVPGIAA